MFEKKKGFILSNLIIFVLLVGSIGVLATDIGIQALECVACGGWNVTSESYKDGFYEELSNPKATGVTTSTMCDYCQEIRTLKEYETYREFYDCIYNYHYCRDCKWESAGWYEKGDLDHRELCYWEWICSTCGGSQ